MRVRQREAVGEQQQVLRGLTDAGPSTDELHRHRCDTRRDRRGDGSRSKKSFSRVTATQAKSCGRCGKEAHPREKCPARDQTCHKCQKKGHFGAMCRTKNIIIFSPGGRQRLGRRLSRHSHRRSELNVANRNQRERSYNPVQDGYRSGSYPYPNKHTKL